MKLALTTLTAVSILALAPQARASRADHLDRSLVEVASRYLSRARMLDYPAAQRTEQYRVVGLPKAPVFHPYDLIGENNLRPGLAGPQFSYNLQLPQDFFEVLPESVAARIAALGLRQDQVDIFCEVQDQPWTGDPLLFRPHYWTDPLAPDHGLYHQNRKIQAGIFEAPAGIHFRGHHPGDFVEADLSVHGPEGGPGTILASPPGVLAMEGLDHRQSVSFWTLTRLGHRAAATLHVLLNDADQAVLEALSPRVTSLRTLLAELEGSPLQGTAMVDNLRLLLRPSLWPSSPEPVVTLAGAGTAGTYHSMPCVPGDLFTGTCRVRAQGLGKGEAVLGLRFESATRTVLSYGGPMGHDKTSEVGPAPVPLGVQGRAPAGATKVLMYVQVLKAEPGAEARFEGVAFSRVAAEPQAPAQPNIWPSEPQRTLEVPAGGGTIGKYHEVPCVPGEVFTGSCQARLEGLTQGVAQIGLRFDSDTTKGLGEGSILGRSLVTGSATPVGLRLRGTVPAGATKALLFLQVVNAKPGDTVRFDGVVFHRGSSSAASSGSAPPLDPPSAPPQASSYPSSGSSSSVSHAPSPSPTSGGLPHPLQAPVEKGVQIRDFKASKAVVAPGEGVDLQWSLTGTPTRLSLAEAVTGAHSNLSPSATTQRIGQVERRQTFKLEAEFADPATGSVAANAAEASVGAQGVALLAGDGKDIQGAYANGHLQHGAAWRHLTGLLLHKGNLFLAEGQDHTLRRLTLHDGALAPFAGVRGSPQESMGGTSGRLNLPGPMAYLAHFIYTVDMGSHTIKRIPEDGRGEAQVFAGVPGKAGLKDGVGPEALFHSPADLVADPDQGILYVADRDNGVIRRIDQSGKVSTLDLVVEKREGQFGERHTLTPTRVPGIQGLALGRDRKLYMTSSTRSVIQVVAFKSMYTKNWWDLSTVAGVPDDPGFREGPASQAQFNRPMGLVVNDDQLLVADAGNNAIRRIRLDTHEVDTLAGLPLLPAGLEDGDRSEARFAGPSRLAVADLGRLFVVDQQDRTLRMLSPDGRVATLGGPGSGSAEGAMGGPAAQARFRKPLGVVVDAAGRAFVADSGNHAIRRVTPAGVVEVFAGSMESPGDADGPGQDARFRDPSELAMDGQGGLYVLEPSLGRLRKITPAGDVTTLPNGPGTPTLIAACPQGRGSAYAVARRMDTEDGPATTNVYLVRDGSETLVASGLVPVALAMDSLGHVYILTENRPSQLVAIHKFALVAGSPSSWAEVDAFSVGPGGRVGKKFGLPRIHGVATDSKGRLYLADSANGLVWKVYFDTKKGEVVAGRHPFLGPTAEVQPLDAPLYQPHRIAVTPMDDVVFTSGHAVLQITAPGTPDNPWTAPRAPGFQGGLGAGGAGRPSMGAILSEGLRGHQLRKAPATGLAALSNQIHE